MSSKVFHFLLKRAGIMRCQLSQPPTKFAFPRDSSDSETQSSIVSSIKNYTPSNTYEENVDMLARIDIGQHLVDMQSKFLVIGSGEIWNSPNINNNNNRGRNKLHKRSKMIGYYISKLYFNR